MLLVNKQKSNLFFLMCCIALLLAMLFVPSVSATPIENESQAAEFCQQLPDGYYGQTSHICTWTKSDADTPCTVTTDSLMPFPAQCGVMFRSDIIGQDSDDLRRFLTGSTGSTPSIEDDCTNDDLSQDCGIVDYIVIFINVLSGLAGIVILGSIIYGGMQYTMAGSDAQKVAAAKDRIRNAIIALLLFIFGYGLLNYLVPGGLL